MHSSDNKNDDFSQAMQGVKPMKPVDKIYNRQTEQTLAQNLKRQALLKEQQSDNNFLSVEAVTPVDPMDMLSYKKSGVQELVFKNLRLGKYSIDWMLDLQQTKLDNAREKLFDAIQNAQQKGIRTMLVKHGIGKDSKPFPAFMKSYVNSWLSQFPQVLAFHSAQRHHGGLSAVYVLIQKSEEAKQANRELHQKR